MWRRTSPLITTVKCGGGVAVDVGDAVAFDVAETRLPGGAVAPPPPPEQAATASAARTAAAVVKGRTGLPVRTRPP
jgi:hypothetical protein